MAGENPARPELAVPQLEVVLHGVVVVPRIDVDEIEGAIWNAGGGFLGGHSPYAASISVPFQPGFGSVVPSVVDLLPHRHLGRISVLILRGRQPRVDRDQLSAGRVRKDQLRVCAVSHSYLDGASEQLAAIQEARKQVAVPDDPAAVDLLLHVSGGIGDLLDQSLFAARLASIA